MTNKSYHTLRLILGDQLNYKHSWYSKKNDDVLYVIMELKQESEYVKHHIQKITGFFAAMFNFQRYLKKNGHHVLYLQLQDQQNTGLLTQNLEYIIKTFNIKNFEYQLPDEYRLDQELQKFCNSLNITNSYTDTEHFITHRHELAQLFEGKKSFLMETFYRKLRVKHQVLMNGNQPIHDRWNFDSENRKKYDASIQLPTPLSFKKNVSEIVKEIDEAGITYIGNINSSQFDWPVTRKESLQLLSYFIEHVLPYFGKYQDAMVRNHWLLFHSRLSFSMNVKMISPMEVIRAVEHAYHQDPDKYTIESTEGFIRQILGWREYMRGIYWAKMPEYALLNYFEHHKTLPSFYWDGKTKMQCMSQAIGQSLEHAYAHHIQRLMVTGAFGLMAQVHPDEMDQWYLGIYMDAIEWVEMPNTRGMSQFADGGIVGTKPYLGSSNYMHKMSDYCTSCHYIKELRYGDRACPLNSLYWNFYHNQRSKLEKNPRIGMMYKTWDRMEHEEKEKILTQANEYLKNMNQL
jgi:deoxyribodipyrimidine photolyase-related protein